MRLDDDRSPLNGFRPPSMPDNLAGRVLGAAHEALAQEPPSLAGRLLDSRAVRLVWATATGVLVLAHVALTLTPFSVRQPSKSTMSRAGDDLREVLDLPSGDLSPRAAALALGASESPDPSEREEKPS